MATTRALSHLNVLIDLTERADRQIAALATTLTSVIAQMDAVTGDADQEVVEVLAEETTGDETEFRLSRTPVGFLALYLDDKIVAAAGYEADLATGVITSLVAVPAGSTLRAEYVVLGLASQTAELLNRISELDAAWFAARKARYQVAIAWIRETLPA